MHSGVSSWTPYVRPESLIYTPKWDDEHLRPFRARVPPAPPPRAQPGRNSRGPRLYLGLSFWLYHVAVALRFHLGALASKVSILIYCNSTSIFGWWYLFRDPTCHKQQHFRFRSLATYAFGKVNSHRMVAHFCNIFLLRKKRMALGLST